MQVRLGAQAEVRPDLILGGAVAYTADRVRANGGAARSSGEGVLVGAVAKLRLGRWTLSGALSTGHGWQENSRTVAAGNGLQAARSKSTVQHVGGRVRAAWRQEFGPSYIRPYADLDLVYTRVPGYRETGAGDLGFEVGPSSDVVALLTPTLEVGRRLDLGDGANLRLYALAGFTLRSNDRWTSPVRLAGSDGAPFVSTVRLPRVTGNAGVGAQLYSGHGLDVRAEYTARAAPDFLGHEGLVRVGYRF